jgi:hypothetical protein
MKFSAVVVLAVAGLTMTAFAQRLEKPRAKTSHSAQKEGNKKANRAVKEPPIRNTAAQDLRRVEQSSAKVSGSKKAQSNKVPRTSPALKVKTKDSNPPIRFASSGVSGKGGRGKPVNSLKGRLKHKGSNH